MMFHTSGLQLPGRLHGYGLSFLFVSLFFLACLPAIADSAGQDALQTLSDATYQAGGGGRAENEQEIHTLVLDKPIERELAGNQTHTYQLTLAAGQYLHAIVDQRGIDVLVTLFGPDGQKLTEVDSPNGTQGPEPVMLVTETTGNYRLEVRPAEKDAPGGRYGIMIKELRRPTPVDLNRVAARWAFSEGLLLRGQGTSESLRKATEKYNAAIRLYRSLGDSEGEATALKEIGINHVIRGDVAGALEEYRRALTLFETIRHRGGEAKTRNLIGAAYSRSNEPKKALDYYNQALPIFHSEGDHAGEAQVLTNIGGVHKDLGDKQKALEFYNRALPLSREAKSREVEAQILHALAVFEDDSGEKRKSLDRYAQALALRRAINDSQGEGNTLAKMGSVYRVLGEMPKALDSFNQALMIKRAIADRDGEARLLTLSGSVYGVLGETKKALDHHEQALAIYRVAGNRRGEADVLANVGGVLRITGQTQKALDAYTRALILYRELKYKQGEANSLAGLGLVYRILGEMQKALDHYGQALVIYRASGYRLGQAVVLTSSGVAYRGVGEMQKALDAYSESLSLYRALDDKRGTATTLASLGSLYTVLGERQKGLGHYNQALSLYQSASDRRGEASMLTNIGDSHYSAGDYQSALEAYHQSLALRQAINDRGGQATTLTAIGGVYSAQNDQQQALEYFMQALPIRRAVGDPAGEAMTHNYMGWAYNRLGDKQKARDHYGQAIGLYRAAGDPHLEASTLFNLARLDRNLGDLEAALSSVEAAIGLVESLRAKLISQDLRASYFATVQGYYKFYIELLMQLHGRQPSGGHDASAFQFSERARARSLLDLLVQARVDIRKGIEPALLDRERTLQRQLNEAAGDQARLLGITPAKDQSEVVKKEMVARAAEIESLMGQYRELQTQIKAKSPSYTALTQPQASSVSEIQRLLDPNSLLLEYALGDDRSYLWAVTPTTLNSYELPKRVEIEKVAERVYELLTARNRPVEGETSEARQVRINRADVDYQKAAADLSEMILKPASAQLGNKRLVIVSDGKLQYIPFATLPKPATTGRATRTAEISPPLIAEHEIVNLPSASTLAVLREMEGRKPAEKTVAVLADPVFDKDDERVKAFSAAKQPDLQAATPSTGAALTRDVERAMGDIDSDFRFPPLRLTATRWEADAITKLVPAREAMQAHDFAASRQTATSIDLSRYRIVHFATHAFINSTHPDLSGIVLSLVNEQGEQQDGFLRMHEIFNLKLPAELVVLSACQTGLGKEVKGEGMIGMTRAFMYAGAPRVVVSLWSVKDRATSELMARFYKKMLGREKKSPAAALRAAQVEMWKQTAWKAPYFWAGFILQGEWKQMGVNEVGRK